MTQDKTSTTRQNTKQQVQHEYNTRQHETTQVQNEAIRVQHETTRALNNIKFILIYLYQLLHTQSLLY